MLHPPKIFDFKTLKLTKKERVKEEMIKEKEGLKKDEGMFEVDHLLKDLWSERCIFLPFWHSYKIINELIWRNDYYHHATLGPLMEYLSPSFSMPQHLSLFQLTIILSRVRLSYPIWQEQIEQMIDDLMNNEGERNGLRRVYLNHLLNIHDLVEFFIPFAQDFRLAVKANSWDKLVNYLYECIPVF